MVVHRPFDWISYPPLDSEGNPTLEEATLKSYTDRKIKNVAEEKVSELKNGGSSYFNLRNTSGTTLLQFLQSPSGEAFGLVGASDWKIATNTDYGLDIVRKATPVLGRYDNEKVTEFKDDGDVNVVKTGGLKVNGVEVALKAQVDQQTETVSAIDDRVTTVEQANYVTPDLLDASFVENNGIFQVSIDDLTSQLGLVGTTATAASAAAAANAVRVTANEAALGLVQTEVAAVEAQVALETTPFALSSAIPIPTDFLDTNTITATASVGATAGVGVVENASGVELQFTLPQGEQGIQEALCRHLNCSSQIEFHPC